MRLQRRASDGRPERLGRLRRGRGAERAAACLLIAKGYRILALRHRTPHGEIDLIACRWGRIAFVEVKRRSTPVEGEAALTPYQAGRVALAADHWIARNPRYRCYEIGLDAVLIAPGHFPRHLKNALDRA